MRESAGIISSLSLRRWMGSGSLYGFFRSSWISRRNMLSVVADPTARRA
jgi:hypothetical protein